MKKAIFLVRSLAIVTGLLLLVTPFFKPQIANAQGPDIEVFEGNNRIESLPPSTTSVQAATVQNGSIDWSSSIRNNGQTPVTNVTFSVMSGLDPSRFDSVPAFPYVNIFPSLAPGEQQEGGKLNPSPSGNVPPFNFALGYDSTKTITPILIPAGGTQQTVTVNVTLVDPQYVSTILNAFHVIFNSNVPGVTVASTTDPTNLDQGEQIQSWNNEGAPTLFHWMLSNKMQLNKQYTFKAVLNVPNPYGVPYEFQPEVRLVGDSQTLICGECVGSTFTVYDPTLDGNLTGQGAVTFSIAESGHMWFIRRSDQYTLVYNGTEQPVFNPPTSKDQCKKDGWQNFTFPSFKNQGDCVSYVATQGKNPPNGK